MKIALFGGSFNPPHLGHVEAARSVVSMVQPDRLLIMPTCVSPHKIMAEDTPSPDVRKQLCELAFGEIEQAEVSDLEMRREGKSYTADTLAQLKELYPCPYRKLEALIKEWDEEPGMRSLTALCFNIAFRATKDDHTLAEPIASALVGIVKKAIKEIDEFEFGCRCR